MSSATIYTSFEEELLAGVPTAIQCEPAAVQNVPEWERIASALAGGGLVAVGAARGRLTGLGLMLAGGALLYRGISGHCMAYEALGINRAGYDHENVGVRAQHGIKHEHSIIIQRSPEELYLFWRQLENLPLIMRHLKSVTQLDNQLSHWVAEGPLGKELAWDAEVINERPGELIAWRSLPGSGVDTAGSVHFEPLTGDRGTLVAISLKYDPPGGQAAAAIADLFGEGLEERLHEDMRRFKQTMETGEIASISGQPQGTCRCP